jgi:precorrin-6B methylase 2
MAFEAISELEGLLRPEDLLFEYGSGGSTLFFARRVAKVVSVEHEAGFCGEVSRRLEEEGIENVEYHCVPPEPAAQAAVRYGSTNAAYRKMSFWRYVTVLDTLGKISFDWIVVDGRARVDCVRHAMAPLRPGGVLVLDNSNRSQYAPAIELLKGWQASHYYGPVFGDYVFSQTSFFRKPPA